MCPAYPPVCGLHKTFVDCSGVDADLISNMGNRRLSREYNIQCVFAADFRSKWDDEVCELVAQTLELEPSLVETAVEHCRLLHSRLPKIDTCLTIASENWSVARMGRMDRAILRYAVYELIFCPNIPVAVSINEAIEIAKAYSSEDSARFIHGVLDRLLKSFKNSPKSFNLEAEELEVLSAKLSNLS